VVPPPPKNTCEKEGEGSCSGPTDEVEVETPASQSLLNPRVKTFADMLTKVKSKGDYVKSKPEVLGSTVADVFSPTFLSQPFVGTQMAGSSTPVKKVDMEEPKSGLKRAHLMTEDSLDQSLQEQY
jgi:hypothetical protein